MLKQILYLIFITIFCFSLSCTKAPTRSPFLLSNLIHIQEFEKQDHSFCHSLEIDSSDINNLNSNLYWRCRLSLAKYRLITRAQSEESKKHNLEISDLITKISVKLADTSESQLIRENKKMDSRQHKQCLNMGYKIATENKEEIDDYFACRRALIDRFKSYPPFNNDKYKKYPNHSYNIGFVINQRLDKEIKSHKAAQEKYPSCIKFNIYSKDFKNCSIAQDNSRQCYSKIKQKKFNKEWEEKIACQKLSYIRFPTSLLKKDIKKDSKTNRANLNSDYYNQNSLRALGLDAKQFGGNYSEEEKKETKKENINVKDGLYNKLELTRIRRDYIHACQKNADKRVKKYIKEQKEICENLKKFDIIKTN